MMPLEAIEVVPDLRSSERWRTFLDRLFRSLHQSLIAENPYGYFVATEPRQRA